MSRQARAWFDIQAAANEPTVVDIHIIDFIGDWIDDYWGFGVTAKSFIDQLSKLPDATKAVKVHINSPGGDVFAALNIANALRALGAKGITVETIVEGLAASAGTIVMMAGSKITVADNALVMVHNPWSYAIGNAAEMRKAADELDKVRSTLVATYQWHSKLDAEAIMALLDAETWMDADEAIANGFATHKTEGLKAAASLDAAALAKLSVPEKFKARVESLTKPTPTPAPVPVAASAIDVLNECTQAGCLDLAAALIAANAPLDEVKASVATARANRDAETQRQNAAREAENTRTEGIRALCTKANHPELIAGYLSGSMTVDAVKSQLAVIAAKLDKVEIDGNIDPRGNSKPPVDVLGSYVALSKKAAN